MEKLGHLRQQLKSWLTTKGRRLWSILNTLDAAGGIIEWSWRIAVGLVIAVFPTIILFAVANLAVAVVVGFVAWVAVEAALTLRWFRAHRFVFEESGADNVEKGLLDFKVEMEQAGNELPRVMASVGHEINRMNKQLRRRVSEWGKATGNIRKQRQIATKLANDLTNSSAHIEERLSTMRREAELFMSSALGFTEQAEMEESDLNDLAGAREGAAIAHKSAKDSRGNIETLKGIVLDARKKNLSQDFNRATELHLVPTFEHLIKEVRELERGYAQIVRAIDGRARSLKRSSRRKASSTNL